MDKFVTLVLGSMISTHSTEDMFYSLFLTEYHFMSKIHYFHPTGWWTDCKVSTHFKSWQAKISNSTLKIFYFETQNNIAELDYPTQKPSFSSLLRCWS